MGTTDNFDSPTSGVLAATDSYPVISAATGRAATATHTQNRVWNRTDIAAVGTVEASKAVILDANKSASGFGALTGTDPVRGLGYATGAGGAVTQATSKSTGVTSNTICGAITMNAASLAATTSVGFTLTNSAIAATDVVVASIKSGATADSYTLTVDAVAAGSCRFSLRNFTAGALAEAVVINYAVLKAVAS